MSYIELPLSVFREYFPAKAAFLPEFLDLDSRYIVRYDYLADCLELGYPNDDCWRIK